MFKLLIFVGSFLLVLTALHVFAAVRFRGFASDLMEHVRQTPEPVLPVQDVPSSIMRFTERAGVDQNQLMRSVHLTQAAELRLKKGGGWQAHTAEQVISTGAPGFVWLAEQKMGPAVKFRVIDAYVGGVGRLNVRVLGSMPVVNMTGRYADLGEAMRYLAELVWAPDAMLGNPALDWQENTDGSVTVGLKLAHDTARATFIFNAEGDITEVRAKDRPAEVEGEQVVLRDWVIKVSGYRDFGSRRVPSEGEVGYVYEDGYEAYWRGEITSYGVFE